MAKILYIEASPRKSRSASIAVARQFIESYRARKPDDTIETLDLWQAALPRFDNETIDAKYAILHGQPHSPEQAKAWQAVEKLAAQFKAADKYVISTPMWNFGIPYMLKHYIDVLVQPGLTFTYSPTEGYKGLVTGKPVVAIYARGGSYPAGTPGEAYDMQSRYLSLVLGFIGLTDIRPIMVDPMLGGPEAAQKGLAAAKAEAAKLAAAF